MNAPRHVLPEVIIIGEFPFPSGTAAANTVQGHCAAIRAAGLTVGLLPWPMREPEVNSDCNVQTQFYREASYWQVKARQRSSRLARYLHLHLGIRDPRPSWLERQDLSGVKAVINYTAVQGSTGFLWRLRSLCKKNNIRLFTLVVEWHALRHVWPDTAAFLDGEIQRRIMNRFVDGTICISQHLAQYYNGRARSTIIVPPLLDLSDPKWHRPSKPKSCEPLTLVFSGSHRRDRHDIILRAVKHLRKNGASLRIEYLGSTRDQISSMPGVGVDLVNSLGDSAVFHGRVPDDRVLEIAAGASFAVLLREDAHWSKCCFPSKVPEFCALGVPIMCNLTSDLHEYLVDYQNALIVEDLSVSALCSTVNRALALTSDQLERMESAARRTATRFDGCHFADVYRGLLSRTPLGFPRAGVAKRGLAGFNHSV